MVDIEVLKKEIVERLKPLEPDKIILFGSYANGTATEESDVDLFLLKDGLLQSEKRDYLLCARKRLRELIYKYHKGIDVLVDSAEEIYQKTDYFHKVDVIQNGVVIYE